jgi:hypothetical protein
VSDTDIPSPIIAYLSRTILLSGERMFEIVGQLTAVIIDILVVLIIPLGLM